MNNYPDSEGVDEDDMETYTSVIFIQVVNSTESPVKAVKRRHCLYVQQGDTFGAQIVLYNLLCEIP